MESLRLSDQYKYDEKDCIICIKRSDIKPTSTENGRQKVWLSAQQRKDDVHLRLSSLHDRNNFKYHANNKCYGAYTKILLHKAENEAVLPDEVVNIGNLDNSVDDQPETSAETKVSRATRSKRALYSLHDKSAKSHETPCVLCNKVKCGKEKNKSCISDTSKAKQFLQITQQFQDDVYQRIAHLSTAESIISAGIYYHANCLRSYELKFERLKKNEVEVEDDTTRDEYFENLNEDDYENDKHCQTNSFEEKVKFTKKYIQSIEHRILSGEAIELSLLTNAIKNEYNYEDTFDNRFVKKVLIDYFGENIGFSYPAQKNKSVMIFYANLSVPDVINSMRSVSKIKECAKDLRNTMKNVDFNLDKKYCDEFDLRESWDNFKFPKEFVEFFAEFFNIKTSRLEQQTKTVDENDELDRKVLKIKCLFQSMYFILNDGRSRTPLHVATGMSVHHLTKSKMTITHLNRIGSSISHSEVERFRVGLAAYTARSAESLTPLPSHFNPNLFTTAAFDNFDHETCSLSGMKGTHDTVSVLFQNKNVSPNMRKSTDFIDEDHATRSLSKLLDCQLKKDFSQLKKGFYLSDSYTASTTENIISPESYRRNFEPDDLAWSICRMKLNEYTDDFSAKSTNDEQNVPSWAAFHSLFENDDRPCTQTGFLPVLPHPVTEYDTVYTSMCNFLEVLKQIKQLNLPATSDESVYKLARHIKEMRSEEMKNLFIMLGDFHEEKVLYSCIGKYLEGSGIDNVFIETNLFGKIVTEQMLSGANYNRAVKGYSILGEALTRFQLNAFFTLERQEKYHSELEILENLQNAIAEGTLEEAKSLLAMFNQSSKTLKTDFEQFIQKRSEQSPLFRYFNNVLIMIDIGNDSHRSVRKGDWKLRVETKKKQQPLNFAIDRIHYARYGPVNLEDNLNLERDMPDIYDAFMKGAFVVKHTPRPFSSVAMDQALEQTINKSGKSTSGIIGSTNKKSAVAVWNLVFHEQVGVHNFFRDIMGLESDNDELKSHHEFNISNTQMMEDAVNEVMKYIMKRGNPFADGNHPLRNIVTGQLVDEKVSEKILDVFKIGCSKFNQYRQERIVQKKVPISDTIHHTKLPNFNTVFKEVEKKSVSRKKDTVHQSLRIVDIAIERGYDVQELLRYEISPKNVLFDEHGLITKEKKKCELTHHLEKHLNPETDYVISNTPMSVVVDVMLYCRKVSWKNLKSFGHFASAFCRLIKSNCFHAVVNRVDFIFDDYFELSPKTSERIRRSNGEFIELFEINSETPLPSQADKFWNSEKNKEMLQVFLRNYIFMNSTEIWPNVELVFSTLKTLECISTISHLKKDPTMSLLQRFDIEEADTKIMLHVNDCCMEGTKKVLLLSSDTDIVALALNFWSTFAANGLQELWMRVGVNTTVRNLPIHKLALKIGSDKCQTIVAAHHLTGADYTSKVGTKLCSLRAKPESYLLQFGRGSSTALVAYCLEMAEKYLVEVYLNNSGCQSFDALRYLFYYKDPTRDAPTLPPTSATIALHILRAFYITYQQVNCFNEKIEKLDPLSYGYIIQHDLLVPKHVQTLLPPINEFVPSCHCKACMFEKSCNCVRAKVRCTKYCSCQFKNTCKNKYNVNATSS